MNDDNNRAIRDYAAFQLGSGCPRLTRTLEELQRFGRLAFIARNAHKASDARAATFAFYSALLPRGFQPGRRAVLEFIFRPYVPAPEDTCKHSAELFSRILNISQAEVYLALSASNPHSLDEWLGRWKPEQMKADVLRALPTANELMGFGADAPEHAAKDLTDAVADHLGEGSRSLYPRLFPGLSTEACGGLKEEAWRALCEAMKQGPDRTLGHLDLLWSIAYALARSGRSQILWLRSLVRVLHLLKAEARFATAMRPLMHFSPSAPKPGRMLAILEAVLPSSGCRPFNIVTQHFCPKTHAQHAWYMYGRSLATLQVSSFDMASEVTSCLRKARHCATALDLPYSIAGELRSLARSSLLEPDQVIAIRAAARGAFVSASEHLLSKVSPGRVLGARLWTRRVLALNERADSAAPAPTVVQVSRPRPGCAASAEARQQHNPDRALPLPPARPACMEAAAPTAADYTHTVSGTEVVASSSALPLLEESENHSRGRSLGPTLRDLGILLDSRETAGICWKRRTLAFSTSDARRIRAVRMLKRLVSVGGAWVSYTEVESAMKEGEAPGFRATEVDRENARKDLNRVFREGDVPLAIRAESEGFKIIKDTTVRELLSSAHVEADRVQWKGAVVEEPAATLLRAAKNLDSRSIPLSVLGKAPYLSAPPEPDCIELVARANEALSRRGVPLKLHVQDQELRLQRLRLRKSDA